MCQLVTVAGERKKLIADAMPVKGTGTLLIGLSWWALLLKNVQHRDVSDVWKYKEGEHAWDAVMRSGVFGPEEENTMGLRALELGVARAIEMED